MGDRGRTTFAEDGTAATALALIVLIVLIVVLAAVEGMGAYESGGCPKPGLPSPDRRLAVAWNDPVSGTGMLGAMGAHPPWDFTMSTLEVGRDAVLRFAEGRLYAVSRTDDSISVVDSDTWTVERVHSLEEGSEPVDIAVIPPETAYVSRNTATHLLRLDLISGVAEDVADLGIFADADGTPDLGTMILVGDRLFVQVRRFDSSAGQFAPPAYLAVVDADSGELIDVDPIAPGVQAIELSGTAPKLKMQVAPGTRRLLVNASGHSFDSGGIEMIDLDLLQSLGLVVREADGRTGVDLGAFVMASPESGFLVYTTDLILSSHLENFTLMGGADREPPLHTVVEYLSPALEFNAQNNALFVPSGGGGGDGVDVFDAVSGDRLTRNPVATSGSPTDLVLFQSSAVRFVRGNSDGRGEVDISDAIFVLNFLFLGGVAPGCCDAADSNDSGGLDLSDPVYLLSFLFLGGSPPPEPAATCGIDPTIDDLTCRSFPPCL